MTVQGMSLEEARAILGGNSVNVSDDCLRQDIDTARFLADIFFDLLKKDKLGLPKKKV